MGLLQWLFGTEKSGLVLGGGGARGFFHIGVIRALQDLEVKIDRVMGCSIGAGVGLLYAGDPQIDFSQVIKELNMPTMLRLIATARGSGGYERINDFVKKITNARKFSDLKIPFSFNATDINSGEEIIFKSGDIFPYLAASMCIPGIFAPMKYNNRFLVDGGMSNNVPISHARECKKIIVSDITGPIKFIDDKSNPVDVLYSSVATLQQKNSKLKQKLMNIEDDKIIYLKLEDAHINILDFRKRNYEYLMDLGYKTAMEHKEEING